MYRLPHVCRFITERIRYIGQPWQAISLPHATTFLAKQSVIANGLTVADKSGIVFNLTNNGGKSKKSSSRASSG